MRIQNISLENFWKKWVDVLATNKDILNFCKLKYNKLPTIYVGINFKNPPTELNCPYIAIDPQTGDEGANIGTYKYSLPIGIGIKNGAQSATKVGDVDVIMMQGMSEINEMIDLVIDAVAESNPNYPLDWKKEIDSVSMFPQFIGFIHTNIDATVCIGGHLEY